MTGMREIATGLKFPEGPIAMADGTVLVVEIEGGRLIRCHPEGRTEVVAELGGGPNGAAIGPDGHCYVCNNGGFNWVHHADGFARPHGRADAYTGGSIQRVDLSTGAVETLYTHCGDVPLFGPNDIVFDWVRGGFWFTDHGKSHDRTMDRGALYYAREDGSFITEVAFSVITANGIGLSPDGDTLYATETETGRLWAWQVTGPGELAKDAWPSPAGGRMVGAASGYQRFDSLALEADGNVCVASLVAGGISVFAPDGSGRVEFVEMPEPYSTNICFGGPDMRTAYITLSGYGRLVALDWPRAGLPLVHQRR